MFDISREKDNQKQKFVINKGNNIIYEKMALQITLQRNVNNNDEDIENRDIKKLDKFLKINERFMKVLYSKITNNKTYEYIIIQPGESYESRIYFKKKFKELIGLNLKNHNISYILKGINQEDYDYKNEIDTYSKNTIKYASSLIYDYKNNSLTRNYSGSDHKIYTDEEILNEIDFIEESLNYHKNFKKQLFFEEALKIIEKKIYENINELIELNNREIITIIKKYDRDVKSIPEYTSFERRVIKNINDIINNENNSRSEVNKFNSDIRKLDNLYNKVLDEINSDDVIKKEFVLTRGTIATGSALLVLGSVVATAVAYVNQPYNYINSENIILVETNILDQINKVYKNYSSYNLEIEGIKKYKNFENDYTSFLKEIELKRSYFDEKINITEISNSSDCSDLTMTYELIKQKINIHYSKYINDNKKILEQYSHIAELYYRIQLTMYDLVETKKKNDIRTSDMKEELLAIAWLESNVKNLTDSYKNTKKKITKNLRDLIKLENLYEDLRKANIRQDRKEFNDIEEKLGRFVSSYVFDPFTIAAVGGIGFIGGIASSPWWLFGVPLP